MVKLSLRTKLILFFFTIAAVPLIVAVCVSTQVSKTVIVENARNYNDATMHSAAEDLNKLLDIAISQGKSIAKDYDIQILLRQEQSNAGRQIDGNALDDRLAAIHGSGSFAHFRTFVITDRGSIYKSSYGYIKEEDMRQNEWYKKTVQSAEAIWYPVSNESFVMADSLFPVITYTQAITDMFNGQKLGIVLVEIDASSMMTGEFINSLLTMGAAGIIDGKGTLIFPSNTDINFSEEISNINSDQESGGFIINGQNGEEFFFSFHRLESGWYLVSRMSIDTMTKDVSAITNIIMPVSISILILAIALALVFTNSVSRPINALINLMQRVENGDLHAKYDTNRHDEIGHLATSYNSMLDTLNHQMKVIEDKQREVAMAQYEVLVAQINPHFLYNTLDSINALARMGKVQETIQVVELLTKFFRGVLSKGKETISVETEISYIETYLRLQQIRYGDRLQFMIECDPKLGHYQVLKMLLQPLVENAIYHGIKNKRDGGHILISVAELEDILCFVIGDTGIGMSVEQLDTLNKELKQPFLRKKVVTNGKGYGICNVNQRIRLYYGPEYGLFYESQMGIGTNVTVCIPKVVGTNEESADR